MNTSRFDYVKYDETATAQQAKLKAAAQKVEAAMMALDQAQDEMAKAMDDELSGAGAEAGERAADELREACLTGDALQRLEQSYMWCGKAIRDQQIERNGSAELQEERKDA